jgi:hypothetical protein
MLLLPTLFAATALAASTYTVTILDDNPDQRTLNTPSTSAGDVVSYLTLHPDGVDSNGKTRYGVQTGVSAGTTVTSYFDIPSSATPTTAPAGTLTQNLPWHQGHHIEVLTTTDPDGKVHEVTRIDQQTTHITVSPTTKPNGDVVLVSSGIYPPEGGVLTTTVIQPPTATQGSATSTYDLSSPSDRSWPVCNNGSVTWITLEPALWHFYDLIIPKTIPPVSMACKGDVKHLDIVRITVPMNGSTWAVPHVGAEIEKLHRYQIQRQIHRAFHGDQCFLVNDLVDFGTCGTHTIRATYRSYPYLARHKESVKGYLWLFLPLGLAFLLLAILACLAHRRASPARAHAREEAEKRSQVIVPVVGSTDTAATIAPAAGTIPPAAGTIAPAVVGPVAATGAGGSGTAGSPAAATGAGGPVATTGSGGSGAAGGPAATTGAGGSGPARGSGPAGGSGTVSSAGAAPTGPVVTGAAHTPSGNPKEVVTTETTKDQPGTLRRAMEEGRAGHRVRFDSSAGPQVDGGAELRTGSEVFDTGSVRGRKRNRGDEPL